MSRDGAALLDILRYSDRALRAAHGRRLGSSSGTKRSSRS
jgi:hypothetical protein